MTVTTYKDIKTILDAHFADTDVDPRSISFNELTEQLSESLHWDAVDSGASIDEEISIHQDLWKQAFEACQQEAGVELAQGDSFSP